MSNGREAARQVKSDQVVYPFQQRRLTESELQDALRGTEQTLESTTAILPLVCWWLGCPSWIYELIRETRSYLHRIGTLIRLRTVPRLHLGSAFGLDDSGRLATCTRTQGRRLGIHKFHKIDYSASLADLEVFLAGWNAGARWRDLYRHACYRPEVCDRDKGDSRLSCMSPLAVVRVWQGFPRRAGDYCLIIDYRYSGRKVHSAPTVERHIITFPSPPRFYVRTRPPPCRGWVGTVLGTALKYRMVRLRRKACYPREWQRVSWSGREDLNLRPPAPKAGALPGCATPRLLLVLLILNYFPRPRRASPGP